jgi:hypothetical protein
VRKDVGPKFCVPRVVTSESAADLNRRDRKKSHKENDIIHVFGKITVRNDISSKWNDADQAITNVSDREEKPKPID